MPRALCLKFAASIPFAPKPDWCSHPIEASVSIKAEEPASPLQLPSGPFAQQEPSEPESAISRWTIPPMPVQASKRAAIWRATNKLWRKEGGPLKSLGWAEITRRLNKARDPQEPIFKRDLVRTFFESAESTKIAESAG